MNKGSETYDAILRRVLSLRDPSTGVWTGELSSSALGTALASVALAEGEAADESLIEAGAAWLVDHANADGGWGDTPESVSNLSTTLIAMAALRRLIRLGGADRAGGFRDASEAVRRAETWMVARTGTMGPEAIGQALKNVYGTDRTFAVPIAAFLAMCCDDASAWLSVPPLPFLLALLPQGVYRFFKLRVVSYALPALIAVGLCRHVCVARICGRWAWGRLFAGALLRRLARLQPAHGGFLDAIPLTAFVCLALRHAGYGTQPAARKGLDFLRRSARADGSWAIDSNVRIWVTSLAARSIAGELDEDERGKIAAWLVKTRVTEKHPFTGAMPGGWAWTDLPGGVPDADDTAGALIALKRLDEYGCKTDMSVAVRAGVGWLLDLQNGDGGMPTFCRGWGKLPFDRSCPDISAHALTALTVWRGRGDKAWDASKRIQKACLRILRYLRLTQENDGSWMALWFGHQQANGGKNPVVGTSRVVDALRATRNAWRGLEMKGETFGVGELLARGESWLVAAQKADGGWSAGGVSTVEETALAVIALTGGGGMCDAAVRRGCAWLTAHVLEGCERPSPIGLYFSLLWYHEKMYPLVWALEAFALNRTVL